MSQLRNDILSILNKLFELPMNTLTGLEVLNEELGWTSIEIIGFIAICDEQFHIIVSPTEVTKAQTVDDLINLIESNATQNA